MWGFLYGPERDRFDFQFDLPARCAEALRAGEVEVGLIPCAELDPLGMDFLPDLGIACDGAVRSILLISKVPFGQIRRLALDSGSRTSVALVRILLGEVYGCRPELVRQAPLLDEMLGQCDAALIIGDPALHLEPSRLPYHVLDLGTAWKDWSGLPMVFAVWAGRREVLSAEVAGTFLNAYRWGLGRLEEMVARAVAERGFRAELAREYLTRHIQYELTARHLTGLKRFRELARGLEVGGAMV